MMDSRVYGKRSLSIMFVALFVHLALDKDSVANEIAGEEVATQITQDSESISSELREISSGNGRIGIFYVHVFNGLFPVPNRYEVRFSRMANETIRMISPPIVDTVRPGSANTRASPLVGVISMGDYAERQKQIAESDAKRQSIVVNTQILKGLNVEISKIVLGNPPKEHSSVLIHDNKEFIQISDDNPGLWRMLLDGFVRY